MEFREGCGAKIGFHRRSDRIHRSTVVCHERLARSSTTVIGIELDAPGERLAESNRRQTDVSQRRRSLQNSNQTTENQEAGGPCSRRGNSCLCGQLDQDHWKAAPALSVHASQSHRCPAYYERLLRRFGKEVGELGGRESSRILNAFHSAVQAYSDVRGWCRHRSDFSVARSQIDCCHHRVFGDRSKKGRSRVTELSNGQRATQRITFLVLGVLALPLVATAENSNTQTAINQIVENYQDCIEAAVAKAGSMKSAALKEKVFNGKKKGCDRSLNAELGIVSENQKQTDLRAEQIASEARIAQITDNLIAQAKNDLGI